MLPMSSVVSNVVRTEFFASSPPLPENFFFQRWETPETPSHGLIFLTHGISEHSDCYDPLATTLAQRGWTVLAWDLYGHGRSPGQRGFIPDFADFAEHLGAMLEFLKQSPQFKTTPLVLFGHSMGGLITMDYLLRSPRAKPDGVVLSSPALGIHQKVSPLKRKAAESLLQLWPTFTMNRDADPSDLVRDPDHQQTYAQDPLRHSKISPPLYLGMKRTLERIKTEAQPWPFPLLLQVAGREKVTNTQDVLDWFKKQDNSHITLKIYEDSYHEIYNDLDRKEVIDHLLQFLRQYEV